MNPSDRYTRYEDLNDADRRLLAAIHDFDDTRLDDPSEEPEAAGGSSTLTPDMIRAIVRKVHRENESAQVWCVRAADGRTTNPLATILTGPATVPVKIARPGATATISAALSTSAPSVRSTLKIHSPDTPPADMAGSKAPGLASSAGRKMAADTGDDVREFGIEPKPFRAQAAKKEDTEYRLAGASKKSVKIPLSPLGNTASVDTSGLDNDRDDDSFGVVFLAMVAEGIPRGLEFRDATIARTEHGDPLSVITVRPIPGGFELTYSSSDLPILTDPTYFLRFHFVNGKEEAHV